MEQLSVEQLRFDGCIILEDCRAGWEECNGEELDGLERRCINVSENINDTLSGMEGTDRVGHSIAGEKSKS